ncbi:mitochondrial antiviral-signaling protein [Melanotaenia boesemani]|uniref:mitochondrial antiviral-signaling protein n=1 Tax=Melanotaenia boesemani TaxID=1250792 RepID=UPI001C03A598|nr:mitochondrial antiviral-signaling protein [Melanotaenia boesemani]
MSFAREKLYNGYLRQNMSTIVSTVKVREIIVHLPCLTTHDRENIEAKRDSSGNYDGMALLLDCLRRRENWPEQFIEALEACEHTTIAAEIRAEYNALKGVNNSSPGSPPTTVTRAHVHPAPAASHPPIPESGAAKSQAAVALPSEAPPAPSEPAAQAPPSPKTPPSAAGQVSEAVSPPKLVPEPPQSADREVPPLPSTPPPSPETPHAQVAGVPLQQQEFNFHQKPEANIQDVSVDTSLIPDEANSGNKDVATLQQQHPVTLCGTDTLSSAVSLQAAVINDGPPLSPTHINSTDESSFPTMTPEKHPVQDTAPPVKISNAVLQPEETSEPPAAKIVEGIPETEPAATTSPEPPADEITTSLDDVCLSKPGQLISVLPQNPASPAAQTSSQSLEPYSGNSERLEISEAAGGAGISTHTPIYSAANSVSTLSCQENSVAPNHNEPEENHYESPNESMVLEVVGHISEAPSILNLDGQTTTPQVQLINGETAKEAISAPPASINNTSDVLSSLNSSCSQSCNVPEPAPAGVSPKSLQKSTWSTNTKFILTAAGVGACALLMAWRLKK